MEEDHIVGKAKASCERAASLAKLAEPIKRHEVDRVQLACDVANVRRLNNIIEENETAMDFTFAPTAEQPRRVLFIRDSSGSSSDSGSGNSVD